MKKVWKGLAAAASAAAIAATGFVGASSAYAEDVSLDVSGKKNITLNGVAAGDTYEAYKLLNVTGATAVKDSDPVEVSSVAYTIVPEYKNILKTALGLTGDVTDKQIIDGISNINTIKWETPDGTVEEDREVVLGSDSIYVREFAKSVMDAINAYNAGKPDTEKLKPADTKTVAKGDSSVTFQLDAGYYLFNQTKNAKPDTNTDSSYIINTAVVADRTIQVKNGTVTLTKKVKDNEAPNFTADQKWNDSADYNIGDTVPFQLTGTLPANFESFKTFKYAFHDVASKGLTVDFDSIKVYAINGTTKEEITDSFRVSSTLSTGETSFTVDIEDLKSINTEDKVIITKDTTIVVEYNAVLNSNAVIGEAGNPNEATIEFSNNSTHDGDGDTEFTPTDKVTVFTYQLNIIKTFSTGAPADNDLPKFTLYKKDGSGKYQEYTNDKETKAEKVVQKVEEKNEDGTVKSTSYVINWEGLDAGDYKLVETHVPGGYVKADDIEFNIRATHDVNSDDPKLTKLESNFPQGKTASLLAL